MVGRDTGEVLLISWFHHIKLCTSKVTICTYMHGTLILVLPMNVFFHTLNYQMIEYQVKQ